MRRAIRHGYLLGLRAPFMYRLVDTLVEVMGHQYDYLATQAEAIKGSMKMEEERFFDTIEAGIKLFNEELTHTTDMFNGEVAFKLYDTYGFPLDLTQDMLREKGIALDTAAFDAKMEAQKAQSKASWKGTGDAAATGDFKALKEQFGLNAFVGYEATKSTTKILALLDANFKQVDTLDGHGWVLLESTPFYAESGGQVGDMGQLEIRNEKLEIAVLDTKKFLEMNLSEVEGKLAVGDQVEAVVDMRRTEIEKHHSATHLLHAALHAVLGSHIAQAGSLNDDKRLRFDFSHPKAVTAEELKQVEAWVNDKIARAIPRETKIMSVDEAKASGAMALFGEKYGDEVRVVRFDDASVELCGGTHVDNAAQIGLFMITKESGVSAGVRRIEAVCGLAAVEAVNALRHDFNAVKTELKAQNPLGGIAKLKEQIKSLKGELQSALSATKNELTLTDISGIPTIIDEVANGDIKAMIDEAKNKYPAVAILLFQKKGDKVLLAAGSKETSIHAGNWIKAVAPILGGGGGGRPDFAQAGGKDARRIDEGKRAAVSYVEEQA
jgi:alanyl-tRNA synthetase